MRVSPLANSQRSPCRGDTSCSSASPSAARVDVPAVSWPVAELRSVCRPVQLRAGSNNTAMVPYCPPKLSRLRGPACSGCATTSTTLVGLRLSCKMQLDKETDAHWTSALRAFGREHRTHERTSGTPVRTALARPPTSTPLVGCVQISTTMTTDHPRERSDRK